MKIGVFGDSFADKTCSHIWWKYLHAVHDHDVSCFGEGGSSLSFSVELIDFYHQDFDQIIWCATSVNRISFWHKDRAYHNTGTSKPTPCGDVAIDEKRKIIHDYLTRAYDWHFQEILGHALISYMLTKYPKIMIVPCFQVPVYFMKDPGFNLYDLCVLETQCFFPGRDASTVINSDLDHRQGHLTQTNQKILAKLIDANLGPGIFSTSYENFIFDKNRISEFGG